MLVTSASSISFTVASVPTARRASPTAIVITESSVKSQPLVNKSNSFVLFPLSNSNGLPIISPKIAPYIYASNLRIAPAALFLCYNISIVERHLYMVAVWATLFRTKANADTTSIDVTYANQYLLVTSLYSQYFIRILKQSHIQLHNIILLINDSLLYNQIHLTAWTKCPICSGK